MSTMHAHVFRAAIAACFLGISTSSAFAYLDPGTGAMILQVLLGGVAGMALVGKLYWHKLTGLFRARTAADVRPAETERTDPRR